MGTFLELLQSHGAPDEIVALAQRLAAATPPADVADDAPPDVRLLVYPDGEGDSEAVEPLTYDELHQLDDYVVSLADDDAAPIELIIAAADVKDTVAAEVAVHDAIAEAAEAARADAVARITGGADPTGQDDSDTGNDDGGEGDPGGDEGVEDPEPATAADPEPVAASSGRTASRSSILANRRNAAARRQPEPEPAPTQTLSRFEFAHGIADPTGTGWTTQLSVVDRALVDKRNTWRNVKGSANGVKENVPVATLRGNFPAERRLVDSDGQILSPSHVSNIVAAAIEQGRAETIERHNGLVAACGLCDISTPIYALETYGVTTRPIRDRALTSFQGQPRGRVVAQSSPTLGDVEGAVSIWTVEDDEAACDPDDPYFGTKPCLRVECGDPIGCTLHAVPVCLTMGNFLARSYPELQAAWTRLAMVAQARIAEQTLFQQMIDQSTSVSTVTETVSAVRDVLAALDLAATGIRSRNRMEENDPMIVILPATFRTVARTDIARQMPGGPTQGNLVVAEQAMNEWFASRFLSVVWTLDVNLIGDQADEAPLAGLPASIDALIYPAGTFIHVDGGELNLGLIRDSTLNATNDFQIFNESFECVLRLGPEAIHLDIEVCPSGAVMGTLDPEGFCA